MSTLTQEIRATDVAPHRKSNRPAPRPKATRDDVAAQLDEWLDEDPANAAAIVARFRL